MEHSKKTPSAAASAAQPGTAAASAAGPDCAGQQFQSLQMLLSKQSAKIGSSSAASSCSAAQPALPPALHSLDREVREAIAVLTRALRPKKEDVEPLLGKWRVQQKRQGKKRPLAETIKDLEDKVIRAAQKLQAELANKPETMLAVSAAQPAATCVSSAAQPASADSPVMTRFLQISRSVNEKECYEASSRSNGHVQNQKLARIGRNDAYVIYLAVLNNLHRREKSSGSHQIGLHRAHVSRQSLRTVSWMN